MKRVKRKAMAAFNALLTMVLAFFGCESGGWECLYGSPYTMYKYAGSVTNEQKEPLKDVQVTIKAPKYDNRKMNYEPILTREDGQFSGVIRYEPYSVDTLNVVFTDTMQVYQADSTQVVVKWQKSEDDWCRGECEFEVNMQLKKNTEEKE